jgi:hypothetical protein
MPTAVAEPIVVYIAGVGRSGSTLLGQLLGQDHRFVNVGELTARFWSRRRSVLPCGCGEPVEQCSFWTTVVERTYGCWDTPEFLRIARLHQRFARSAVLPLALLLPWQPARVRRDADELGDHIARLMSAVADVAGAPVVVDGSKNPIFAIVLACRINGRLRLVHLVRNANGVAYSWTKLVRKPLLGEPDAEMSRYRPGRIAVRWVRRNLVLELYRRRTRAELVRYEDLAHQPAAELARIRSLVDATPSGSESELESSSTAIARTHTWGGNPMRFRSGQVKIRVDEQWRHALPRRERLLVTAVAGPLLAAYGYRRAASPRP